MTTQREQPSRRRKRRRPLARLAVPAALIVVFVAGIGLGEALHDNPKVGGTQTLVRTLRPLPLVPVASPTAAGTTTNP
jgi:hypothetical protein